ncbi:MAG: hypothetical protein ACR2LX_12640 [Jatrophihabitans sp.]
MTSRGVSFPFAFERRYAVAGRGFGITEATTSIVIGGGQLQSRFGPWHIETPLDNITSVELTGRYAFIKTAGPARLGLTDRGLTFATNSRAGVCVEFAEAIRGIDPRGWIRHPNLTLTPADCAGLAAALTRR